MANKHDWMDDYGACRVCGGEIPHGHDEKCWVHKAQIAMCDAETLLNLLKGDYNHPWPKEDAATKKYRENVLKLITDWKQPK